MAPSLYFLHETKRKTCKTSIQILPCVTHVGVPDFFQDYAPDSKWLPYTHVDSYRSKWVKPIVLGRAGGRSMYFNPKKHDVVSRDGYCACSLYFAQHGQA